MSEIWKMIFFENDIENKGGYSMLQTFHPFARSRPYEQTVRHPIGICGRSIRYKIFSLDNRSVTEQGIGNLVFIGNEFFNLPVFYDQSTGLPDILGQYVRYL